MQNKWPTLVITLFSAIICAKAWALNPLLPGTPVPITNSNDIAPPGVVAGTSSGFIFVGVGSSENLVSSFSNNGTSWTTPSITIEGTYTIIWTNATEAGAISTWIGPSIGYITDAPTSSFSLNNGSSWSSSLIIKNVSTVNAPVVVSGTSDGFLATWCDSADSNPYASFTDNNGTSWTTAVEIDNTGTVYSPTSGYSGVFVSGTSAGFMSTWLNTAFNAVSSFSNDNGATWSTPLVFTTTGDINSDVWVCGTNAGFMTTWADNTGNAFSSFSADNGNTWSSPVQITSGLHNLSDVSVSGSDTGFVAAWVGSDSNAYASFSSNNGTTWSTPVQITNDGSINIYSNGFTFVSVSVVDNTCMFSWVDNTSNAISSYSLINGSPPVNPPFPPASLSGSQYKNNFGIVYELYNLLQWQPSLSQDVTGYFVYRNAVKIATLNANTFNYEDHNIKKGSKSVYSVTAFDSQGNESSQINVTIY